MKRVLINLLVGASFMMLSTSVSAQENELIPENTISVSGGYGILPELSPWGNGYRSESKGGFSGSLQYARLYKSGQKLGVGFGLVYSIHKESADYFVKEGGFSVKDRPALNYIAPMLVVRRVENEHWMYGMNIGIGYLNYYNKGKKEGLKSVITGNSIGMNVDLTGEYRFNKHWGIGADVSFNGGYIKKLHDKTGDVKETVKLNKDNRINAFRIDFLLGIRYHF